MPGGHLDGFGPGRPTGPSRRRAAHHRVDEDGNRAACGKGRHDRRSADAVARQEADLFLSFFKPTECLSTAS